MDNSWNKSGTAALEQGLTAETFQALYPASKQQVGDGTIQERLVVASNYRLPEVTLGERHMSPLRSLVTVGGATLAGQLSWELGLEKMVRYPGEGSLLMAGYKATVVGSALALLDETLDNKFGTRGKPTVFRPTIPESLLEGAAAVIPDTRWTIAAIGGAWLLGRAYNYARDSFDHST
jgi:hypothetical protein